VARRRHPRAAWWWRWTGARRACTRSPGASPTSSPPPGSPRPRPPPWCSSTPARRARSTTRPWTERVSSFLSLKPCEIYVLLLHPVRNCVWIDIDRARDAMQLIDCRVRADAGGEGQHGPVRRLRRRHRGRQGQDSLHRVPQRTMISKITRILF
jgi:hypothetical protein